MSKVYNAYLELAYENTNFTRTLKFEDVNSSIVSGLESRINQYNQNLSAADKNIFISDDYDSANEVGKLQKISKARIEEITETIIQLGS